MQFCTLCTCIFQFRTFRCSFRSLHDVKWPVLYVDDDGTWWHIFNFFFLSPNRWYQLNSGINITHFAGTTTWNYWKTIVEMPSYIFIWRSPCRNVYPWVTEEILITKARNPIRPLGCMIFVLQHRFYTYAICINKYQNNHNDIVIIMSEKS